MSNEHILVVDDRQVIRDSIVDILKLQGYVPLTANDGLECMKCVRQEQPDLILLDLQMPRMNGLEVLDELNELVLDIPVILMTAHGSEDIAVEVFRKGVRDYLKKLDDTFSIDEMLAAIERSLTEVRLRKEKRALTEKLQTLNERLVIANADLKQRIRQLNTLYKISKSVSAGNLDPDALMGRVITAATILSSSHEGAIFLYEGEQLVCRALKEHTDERPYALHQIVDDPLVNHVIGTCQPHTLSEKEIIAAGKKNPFAPTGAMAAPLMIAGEPIGALLVRHMGTSVRTFDKHDIAFLNALADYAAIALESTLHYSTNGHSTTSVGRVGIYEAPPPPQKIFISYSRGDWDDYVKPLVDRLTDEGFNVWIDQNLLLGGQDWLDQINEALSECKVMVLCVSPEALESIYVRMEYRYFFHEKKPILPLMCREARLPAELRNIQHMPYTEMDKLIVRMKRLLNMKKLANVTPPNEETF